MGAMPSASWGPGLAPQVCLRGTLEATCTLRSSPDWLLRATSSLLGCGGPLAPAHCLWATTSGPAPEEAGARVSRWGHTRTHSAAETGAAEKGGAGPDAASPSAHAPAAAPGSSPPTGPPAAEAAPQNSHDVPQPRSWNPWHLTVPLGPGQAPGPTSSKAGFQAPPLGL